MKYYNVKSIIAMVLGVLLIGSGVAFLSRSNQGVDPYSAMNYGISSLIGTSFGNWQLALNVILFLPMLFLGRKYIGLGSLANMVGVGYIAQFTEYIFKVVGLNPFKTALPKVGFLVLGVVLICFGCAMYTKANLGIAPYDALAYIVEEMVHGKLAFRWIRVLTDIVCVVVAFLTGGTLGVSTIIMMFFTGPLVQYFKDLLSPVLDSPTKHKHLGKKTIA
jgi:uncharacterized membrane protein YczE